MLSNPKLALVQGPLNVVMKQNVTLSCLSEPGYPPVRYTLFKHNQQVSALNRSDLTPALFTLTISSASDTGEYKCKAEYNNSSGGKYSNSLNFTFIGMSCCHLPSTGYCRGIQPSLFLTEELKFTAVLTSGAGSVLLPRLMTPPSSRPSSFASVVTSLQVLPGACPVLGDSEFSVFFLQSQFPNQCWAHPPLRQRKARTWPCPVSQRMDPFPSHINSSKEDKAFLPKRPCRRGKQLWFFYLWIPLVTLEPINAKLVTVFPIIQNTATLSTLH